MIVGRGLLFLHHFTEILIKCPNKAHKSLTSLVGSYSSESHVVYQRVTW